MSNIRLFFSNTLSADTTDKLDKSQSHYLAKVMRIKESEVFSIFNKNGEWEAKVSKISKGIVEFKTIKQLRKKESSKELWLAFSPIKSNYQNFMIQKATELGVTKFLPIIFDRTVVRKINNERLGKIVIEASEQSNRLNVPEIAKVQNLKEFWLAFSPIKSNYQNFMIQKATELGVTKFLPIIFDRTVVRKINNERLEKIVIEASEQSNRLNVPEIEKAQDLKNFLNSNSMDLIFTDLNSDNKKIEKSKLTDKPICIIIGPEGDFSEAEREEILSFKGVQSLKINENILRSETAVISAISIINYVIN